MSLNHLYYFREKDGILRGDIDLTNLRTDALRKKSSRKDVEEFTFEIHTSNRVYYITAPSEPGLFLFFFFFLLNIQILNLFIHFHSELNRWVDAIERELLEHDRRYTQSENIVIPKSPSQKMFSPNQSNQQVPQVVMHAPAGQQTHLNLQQIQIPAPPRSSSPNGNSSQTSVPNSYPNTPNTSAAGIPFTSYSGPQSVPGGGGVGRTITPVQGETLSRRNLKCKWPREDWFFGQLSRAQAEKCLLNTSCDLFLIRCSSQSNAYAFSKYSLVAHTFIHFVIEQMPDGVFMIRDCVQGKMNFKK